jgi:hypothetical protein
MRRRTLSTLQRTRRRGPPSDSETEGARMLHRTYTAAVNWLIPISMHSTHVKLLRMVLIFHYVALPSDWWQCTILSLFPERWKFNGFRLFVTFVICNCFITTLDESWKYISRIYSLCF